MNLSRFVSSFLLFLFVILRGTSPLSAVTLPSADRVGASLHFTRAQELFLEGSDKDVLHEINEALGKNPYLIDAYLLRALTYRRLGLLEEAEKQIASYLEVNIGDEVGLRIQRQIVKERQTVDLLLRGEVCPDRFYFTEMPIGRALGLAFWKTLSFQSPHQPVQAFGRLYCADTRNRQVLIISLNGQGKDLLQVYDVPQIPRAVLPLSEETFLVVDEEGRFLQGNLNQKELGSSSLPSLPVRQASDILLVARDRLAVADWSRRRVLLWELSSGKILKEWTPKERENQALFDPAALAVWANRLVVADRGNDRLHLLTLPDLSELGVVAVPKPRDILFYRDPGRILLLDEDGYLSVFDLHEGKSLRVLNETYPNRDLWSLFSYDQVIWAITFNGKRIVTWTPVYSDPQWPLFVIPHSFKLQAEEETPCLNLTLNIAGPQVSLVGDLAPALSATLLNKALEPRYGSITVTTQKDLPLLITDNQDRPSNLPRLVLSGERLAPSFFADLSDMEPPGVVLDGAFPLKHGDAQSLLAFCLINGLPVHLWATDVPSSLALRLLNATGGDLLFLTELNDFITQRQWALDVRIPLLSHLIPEGRLSSSLLALYLDAGAFSGRTWFPFVLPHDGGEL